MKLKTAWLLTALFVLFLMATVAFFEARLRPDESPTVEFAGRTPDGSQVLFNIRNASSKPWNFMGTAPDAPYYSFQMPSGRPVSAEVPLTAKLSRHVIPAHSKIMFTVPLPPGDTQTINVKLAFFPGTFSQTEQNLEYYGNRLRRFLGQRPVIRAVTQESGVVDLLKQ